MEENIEDITLQVTPTELRLMIRLVEANDSGQLDRRGRLGHLRTRTTLTHKLYTLADTIPSGQQDDES